MTKETDPHSRNLPLAPAGAGEALPACPACDGPPTRCDCEPGCSMMVCLNPKCPMDAVHELLWRRLSAPCALPCEHEKAKWKGEWFVCQKCGDDLARMPPEVVEILKTTRLLLAVGHKFIGVEALAIDVERWIAAGRPGLPPDAPEGEEENNAR